MGWISASDYSIDSTLACEVEPWTIVFYVDYSTVYGDPPWILIVTPL